jgi:hypothetical protein
MSKLSALLRRASRSEPAPMGFTALSGRAKTPEMLLSAILPNLESNAATAAAKAGADFFLLESGDLGGDAEAIKALTGSLAAPCGLRLSRPDAGAAAAARDLGLDYLHITDYETPAAALLDEETGFVLSLADDTDDTFLRILESMPFEAIYAGELSGPFTLARQLELRRIAGLTRKPLLLQLRDTASSQDLECLRDSGVAAVLVEARGKGAEQLSALRQAIGAMSPRRRRRGDRESMAVLPSTARTAESDDDEDD